MKKLRPTEWMKLKNRTFEKQEVRETGHKKCRAACQPLQESDRQKLPAKSDKFCFGGM